VRCRNAGIAAIRGERTEVVTRFAPHARLTQDAIRILIGLYKKHRFTGESVTFTLTTPKIMEEVEGMVEILERALNEAVPAAAAARR
jgi:hypothetical protein